MMCPNTKRTDYLPQELHVGTEDIAQRKRFLEFSDADIELLGEIHKYLEDKSIDEFFIDSFYQHLYSFPALQKLLPDESTINRLKAVQRQYFMRLTAGDYGDDYVLDRLRVGYAHQRVGLEPKWYTGAYRKYLSSLQPILHEMYGHDHVKFMAAYDALLKVVFLDMELALDTYFHTTTQELLRLANYDALTGLPNRVLFNDRVEQELKKARRAESPLAILMIDLDRFKEVNDTLGHGKGDVLLIEAAKRISGCMRETDTVARFGGDEFTVILPGLIDNFYAERIAQNIIQELHKPFMLDTNMVNISASIGIAIFPVEAQDVESLLKHADQAMYVAKAEGRNRFSYFTESMQQAANEKHALTNDLRQALSRHELHVYYQPIVELRSGRILKAEALLRWKHPKRGMVSAATFIPLAEESGLIHEIGDWVLNESIDSVRRWLNQYGRIIQVSVNKSPIQFDRREEITWADALDNLKLPGNSITVEITEGLLLKDSSKVKQQLLEFRNSGIEVSIDDFGTGFSALSYLKKFDIDYLKIDRSFIKDLELEENDMALTEAIIVMAHKLGFKTIAEGVETEGQFSLLKSFGCDYAQGFLFSPAVPGAEFEQIIARQS
ncbi:phytochrome-like protein cph2 [mine drainage metagenome]|uniref:Diguanylate cyclase DosC n=1 Tax=mine drainage metagenome TaxID=410659 RepID=A0A1J5SA93_9ZZZZ